MTKCHTSTPPVPTLGAGRYACLKQVKLLTRRVISYVRTKTRPEKKFSHRLVFVLLYDLFIQNVTKTAPSPLSRDIPFITKSMIFNCHT